MIFIKCVFSKNLSVQFLANQTTSNSPDQMDCPDQSEQNSNVGSGSGCDTEQDDSDNPFALSEG